MNFSLRKITFKFNINVNEKLKLMLAERLNWMNDYVRLMTTESASWLKNIFPIYNPWIRRRLLRKWEKTKVIFSHRGAKMPLVYILSHRTHRTAFDDVNRELQRSPHPALVAFIDNFHRVIVLHFNCLLKLLSLDHVNFASHLITDD